MNKYSVIKFQAPFEKLKEYDLCPEVRLYKAVITQAIIDVSNNSDTLASKKMELETKNWFFGDSDDFREVCNKADLTPEEVVMMAKIAIGLNNSKFFYKYKKYSKFC
jgi:hypothetical protein